MFLKDATMQLLPECSLVKIIISIYSVELNHVFCFSLDLFYECFMNQKDRELFQIKLRADIQEDYSDRFRYTHRSSWCVLILNQP